jgi:hypothetical protein
MRRNSMRRFAPLVLAALVSTVLITGAQARVAGPEKAGAT